MIFAQSYKNLSYLQKKKENFSSFIKEKQYLCTLINQKYDMPQSLHIAIIGGGAAGFFAAIEAKRNFPHADITIFEKNSKVLAKVEITGGGRCNLTNSFDEISDLKQAYPRGHKLMKRLFKRFDYLHAFDWFEENGVPLVTQEDQCVFPQSQDSQSIINCLVNTAKRLGVKIQCNHQLTAITELEDERLLLDFKISKEKGNLSGASSASHPVSEIRQIAFHRVAITTGGHPKIENFKHLSDLGHAIEQPIPSLFTFNIADKAFKNLMGTVVEPVYTSIPGTKLKAEGPLLITHWGMSGPAVLKLSSHAARYLHENNYQIKISVNWVHESNRSLVEENIQGIIIANPQKQLASIRPYNLPSRLWLFLIQKMGYAPEKKWSEMGKKGCNLLIETLTNDLYQVNGKGAFKEEFVTCGGISLNNIDLHTLESKVCPHLFFAGEVLDIDAITGGFNLQAAWTTGYVVGQHIGE